MVFDLQCRKMGLVGQPGGILNAGSIGNQSMNRRPAYRFDDFVVDPEAWRLTRCGTEIHLDPVVLKLLIYLISNKGRLVTRDELMDTVWGDTVISESALSQAVLRLRKALGDDDDIMLDCWQSMGTSKYSRSTSYLATDLCASCSICIANT